MQYRSFASIISSGVIGLASLASAPSLHAQARFTAASSPVGLPPTSLLGTLSQYRAVRSFADAQSVKRSMVYRVRSVALENQ